MKLNIYMVSRQVCVLRRMPDERANKFCAPDAARETRAIEIARNISLYSYALFWRIR